MSVWTPRRALLDGGGGRGKWEVTDTYNDWDGGGSAQDLLHQPVSVVQGFHDQPLVLGDLEKKMQRKFC